MSPVLSVIRKSIGSVKKWGCIIYGSRSVIYASSGVTYTSGAVTSVQTYGL
jgi:hypothetical protein